MTNGTKLALGTVAALALTSALRRRGSRAMEVLLLPKSQCPMTGPEKGRTPRNGIARLDDAHGSVRYLRMKDGQAVSVLQVMKRTDGTALIAHVYTDPSHRWSGLARGLLERARRDFDRVDHSEHLTSMGERWKARVQGSRSSAPRKLRRRGSRSAGPRLIRSLPKGEAVRTWRKLWLAGKHKGEKLDSVLERSLFRRGERWVEAEVPLELLDADMREAKSISRVQSYASRKTPFPPGIAGMGQRALRRGLVKASLRDGNHRYHAAVLRGDFTMRVLMPQEDWERLLEADKIPKLYHTTAYSSMATIVRNGLSPDMGGTLFSHGSYGNVSRGKVFLAEGLNSALEWFSKIEDMLEHRAGDDAEPGEIVPVMLRLTRRPMDLELDPEGGRDVISGRALFTRKPIYPEHLLFWNPVQGRWCPLDEWGGIDPMLGIKEVEHYDDDGDVVEQSEPWTSRGLYVVGPYDDGGFKPPSR